MNDLEDITDWREEFRQLENSPARKELYPGTGRTGPGPKIPLSNIYEFAELLLRLEETKQAVLELHNWQEENREALDDLTITTEHSSFPREQKKLLWSFAGWYELKRMVGPDRPNLLHHSRKIAAGVLTGEFSSIRCREAYEYASKYTVHQIELDVSPSESITH